MQPESDIKIDPQEYNYNDIYKLMVSSIVPRPIAFVSSKDAQGRSNLAPFSYFTFGSSNPPLVMFCPAHRGPGKPPKDTLHNISETAEFVVNIVSEEFLPEVNSTSAEFPPDIDEFVVSGLTPVPSVRVQPFRVLEAHIQMECKLTQLITLSEKPGGGTVVVGEVVLFHVDSSVLVDPEKSIFNVDPDKLRAVGRMGGTAYSRTLDRLDLKRPK